MLPQQSDSERTIRRALDLVWLAGSKRPGRAAIDLDLAAALLAEVIAETERKPSDV